MEPSGMALSTPNMAACRAFLEERCQMGAQIAYVGDLHQNINVEFAADCTGYGFLHKERQVEDQKSKGRLYLDVMNYGT
jgi:hypothetical protein